MDQPVNDLTPLRRGVYKAPYTGPNGEWVFMAIKADGCLLTPAPVVASLDAPVDTLYGALWRQLDNEDPTTTEQSEALTRRADFRLIP